jgi:hypothetical protein
MLKNVVTAVARTFLLFAAPNAARAKSRTKSLLTGRRKIVATFLTIAVLIVPTALRAEKPAKPYNVRMTGVGAALNAADGSFRISIERDTPEGGATTTTMDLFFLSSDTEIHFSGTIPNYLVTPSKDALSLFFRPSVDFPDACFGSSCGQFFSLSFTKNKTYRFERVGSEHGVCANGVRIEDTFKQTFDGADVTGLLAGASFFSTAGQLSTFRGDPALSKDAGATPCVLP